jgi:hypothetical protein
VLGSVTTALGGFGVFAAFTDSVPTGTNSITTDKRAPVAVLQIALEGVTSSTDCPLATYVNETTTPFFNIADFAGDRPVRYFCLRNIGSAPLGVVSTLRDLTDTDVDCTGDEKMVDETCGGDGPGELAPLLRVTYGLIDDCSVPTIFGGAQLPLDPNPVAVWKSIAPEAFMCGLIRIFGPGGTEEQLQAAQTDRVTWRFQFDATAG